MKSAVVIPAYRASRSISRVLASIPDFIDHVIVVDDCCPESSGKIAEQNHPHVHVLRNDRNLGVGGATLRGYREAKRLGADVAVKMDADGQMDSRHIRALLQPIQSGLADYAKGNRFFRLDDLQSMPAARLFGNAALSLINKVSSGYWNIMDPTNGFTALHLAVLDYMPLEKLDHGYFFESDMLFRLGTIRAVVKDVPMPAIYGDENSQLHLGRAVFEFGFKHLRNTAKRLFYTYFLRDFHAGTIQLILSFACLLFGGIYGGYHWWESVRLQIEQPTGVIMIAALPVVFGVQLLINVFNWDVTHQPETPLHLRVAHFEEDG